MHSLIKAVEAKHTKKAIPEITSGDVVRVHQEIKEGEKKRTQVFEGLVIRTKRMNSSTASITVRRIASGVGVEKLFMLHSPAIKKVEIVRRSKVRRNYLSYMRQRTGKSARLTSVNFDKIAANKANEVADEPLVPADNVAAPEAQVEKANPEPKPEEKSSKDEKSVDEVKEKADKPAAEDKKE